ncbi:hypothetical protein [Tessaracoccus palaemonis]|uniref:Uncharacterized protein n=1 Tax=Tessaracoccus palaemonis TaxID=2829499 RepID=A0ABX8SN24_9ACTN|nr:hypothetical protein [Tessaracoccus palaemonis]QXT63780.1 hypothetical protein KDB89_04725 [Tessaracoccus palaemonis]
MITDPGPAPRRLPVPAILIGLGILVIVGYVVWQVIGGRAADSAAPGATSASPMPAVTPVSATPVPSSSGAGGTPMASPTPSATLSAESSSSSDPPPSEGEDSSQPDPEKAALRQLKSYAKQYDAIVAKDDQWVAQLSSKYVGVSDPLLTAANGTHTFFALDILSEFEDIAQSVTSVQVVLLDSRDFGKQQLVDGKNLWITFGLSDSFTSEDDVLDWCADEFPQFEGRERLNVCMPRQLKEPNS